MNVPLMMLRESVAEHRVAVVTERMDCGCHWHDIMRCECGWARTSFGGWVDEKAEYEHLLAAMEEAA